MTEVHWLQQIEADVPVTDAWLSQHESACLDSMRFAKRRSDWRLGRWTAKLAVAAYRELPENFETLRNIEIRATQSGAPEALIGGDAAAVTVSLSHRDGISMCAVAPSSVALGCDLETVENRSECFVVDYFTEQEQKLVARAGPDGRSLLLALLWSGKESALKALCVGLRLDTRSVVVGLDDVEPCSAENGVQRAASPDFILRLERKNRWFPFHVDCTSGQVFHGWWQNKENFVQTLVADPPSSSPISLELRRRHSQGLLDHIEQRGTLRR